MEHASQMITWLTKGHLAPGAVWGLLPAYHCRVVALVFMGFRATLLFPMVRRKTLGACEVAS